MSSGKSTILSTVLLLSVFAISPATAQDSSSVEETSYAEVKEETRELTDTLERFGVDQRDEALKAATAALFELDNRIRDFQYRIDNRWNDMNQAARDETRASLGKLQRQRIELAEWFGGLKNDSGTAWNDIRQGFSQVFSKINEGWEKALREFDSKTDSAG